MDQKQLEILERAGEVFMRYGVRNVTMDDIARELGMSKKTIYKYFADKNALVKEIVNVKIEMDKTTCVECTTLGGNAIDILLEIGTLVVQHIQNINPTVFYDLKKYHPDAWKIMEEHKHDFVFDMIRKNIQQGIEENIYRDNINPDIIARLYVSNIDLIMNGETFTWPEYRLDEVLLEVQRFHIRGMANDHGIKYLQEKLNKKINE